MAATSKHYGDLIRWGEAVICSCKSLEQIRTAERLIDLIDSQIRKTMGGESYYDAKMTLIYKLRQQEDAMWDKKIEASYRQTYSADSDEGNLS